MANIIELNTEDNLQYQFYPVPNGIVNFKVKSANDAHIALTMAPQESEPMYEVFIGGWGNTKSVIRRNRTKPDVVEIDTPNILSANEYRGFWVRWDCGIISAGREGEVIPFMSWSDPEPFPIAFVGVCTGWGASGSWQIEEPPAVGVVPLSTSAAPGGSGVWVDATAGQVPPGAVAAGQDASGEPLYIARANHEGGLIPGKLVASHGCAYIPWGGAEHAKSEYQVLVNGQGQWVAVSGANVPQGALPAGESEDGEPLFVGRVPHEGSLTAGKVQPSHGTCYIPFGGQELGFQEYEVLLL